mmetsp:Transcript_50286/g.114142  ORF Transcript_50286/g.114142 Transcript_50286/m.114142 type:complete len:318 (+) Transcript_50286:148-1101(+)
MRFVWLAAMVRRCGLVSGPHHRGCRRQLRPHGPARRRLRRRCLGRGGSHGGGGRPIASRRLCAGVNLGERTCLVGVPRAARVGPGPGLRPRPCRFAGSRRPSPRGRHRPRATPTRRKRCLATTSATRKPPGRHLRRRGGEAGGGGSGRGGGGGVVARRGLPKRVRSDRNRGPHFGQFRQPPSAASNERRGGHGAAGHGLGPPREQNPGPRRASPSPSNPGRQLKHGEGEVGAGGVGLVCAAPKGALGLPLGCSLSSRERPRARRPRAHRGASRQSTPRGFSSSRGFSCGDRRRGRRPGRLFPCGRQIRSRRRPRRRP